jgi:hypothetical protein
MKVPKIMMDKPEPKMTLKSFHGKKIQVWEGRALVDKIHGWVKNPRIDLELKRFRDNHAGRDPNGDEIFSIMKNIKDFRLKDLAADVRSNGVRQPIIITNAGKLLDGNRRYYSTRLILEDIDPANQKNSEFGELPVWVLHDDCSEEDEEHILVQENFYAAQKVEWPDYVKAQHVYEEIQAGLPVKSVAQKYAWSQSKVSETKRIMELIDEFREVATGELNDDDEYSGFGLSDLESERVAAEKYQFFNEAQKSFRARLEKDFDFKMNFFRMLLDGKFKSFAEVRVATKAWDSPRAKKILLSDDPKAAKKAKAIVDYEESVEKEEATVEDAIIDFVKFLGDMTTDQKAKLRDKPGHLEKLKDALNTVIEMTESTKH